MSSKRKRRAARPAEPSRGANHVAAADFKAHCLRLFNRVRETGVEYVVTKHGTPVAKVVPYRDPPGTRGGLFGSMQGTVLRYDRPFDSIDGEYEINKKPQTPNLKPRIQNLKPQT